MRAACETKRSHAGPARCRYAGDAVFDDNASTHIGAHLSGCKKKDVGRGLAILDEGNGENMRIEEVEETGLDKAEAELARLAA